MELVLFIAIVALTVSLIYILARRVDLGLFCLLAVNLYDQTFGLTSSIVGRVHLDPLDAISICLLIAGGIRTVQGFRAISLPRIISVSILIIFLISIGRGFVQHGVIPTSNEARQFTGILIAALYFVNAPVDNKSIERYVRIYMWFGGALCVVVALAAAGLRVGQAAVDPTGGEIGLGRYVNATAAAAIAISGLFALALYHYRARGTLRLLLPVMYISVAILLRHRTVWMMLLVGVITLIPMDPKLFRIILPAALLAALSVGLIVTYGTVHHDVISESEFSEAATNSQTWEWRVNGWRDLLFDEEQTTFSIAMGKSMGSGFWRIDPESYRVITAPPHSEYIADYLRIGVIGTFCVLLFITIPLARLWTLQSIDQLAVFPSVSAWAIALVMITVYGVTYGLDTHHYALVGIANAIVLERRVTQAERIGCGQNEECDPVKG